MPRARESRLPRAYDVASRALIALFFLGDGWIKLIRSERSIEGLSGMGLALPAVFNYTGAAVELAGALLLILNARVWAASLTLALYLLPATFLMHGLLAHEHPSQLVLILRDLALVGGLVVLAGAHRRGDAGGPAGHPDAVPAPGSGTQEERDAVSGGETRVREDDLSG